MLVLTGQLHAAPHGRAGLPLLAQVIVHLPAIGPLGALPGATRHALRAGTTAGQAGRLDGSSQSEYSSALG